MHWTSLLALLAIISLSGCTAPRHYAWQDISDAGRTASSARADLEACRAYAARQYQPGTPAGDPYLAQEKGASEVVDNRVQGEWRPDRSPERTMHVNHQPTHQVPAAYTGYPGELDYHPDYLDAILEKCMRDRYWAYRAETPASSP